MNRGVNRSGATYTSSQSPWRTWSIRIRRSPVEMEELMKVALMPSSSSPST